TSGVALSHGNNKFTAYATEDSAINNEDGESNTVEFEVDTLPPNVAITKGPEPRSSNTKPTFEGTASENTEVVVHIKLGTTEVATGSTTAAAGKWSMSALSKLLPAGGSEFRGDGSEKSGIGNPDGKSEPPVSFEVDTEPPEVEITKGPEPRSNNVKPTFEGTASENTDVTVHVKLGEGEVSTATTKASGGKWSLTVSTALPP